MRKIMLAAAGAAALAGAPALAQDTATTDAMGTTDTMTAMPVEDDRDDFPWGLLGLLGLAGLLGRKRDTHVHTDTTRRNP